MQYFDLMHRMRLKCKLNEISKKLIEFLESNFEIPLFQSIKNDDLITYFPVNINDDRLYILPVHLIYLIRENQQLFDNLSGFFNTINGQETSILPILDEEGMKQMKASQLLIGDESIYSYSMVDHPLCDYFSSLKDHIGKSLLEISLLPDYSHLELLLSQYHFCRSALATIKEKSSLNPIKPQKLEESNSNLQNHEIESDTNSKEANKLPIQSVSNKIENKPTIDKEDNCVSIRNEIIEDVTINNNLKENRIESEFSNQIVDQNVDQFNKIEIKEIQMKSLNNSELINSKSLDFFFEMVDEFEKIINLELIHKHFQKLQIIYQEFEIDTNETNIEDTEKLVKKFNKQISIFLNTVNQFDILTTSSKFINYVEKGILFNLEKLNTSIQMKNNLKDQAETMNQSVKKFEEDFNSLSRIFNNLSFQYTEISKQQNQKEELDTSLRNELYNLLPSQVEKMKKKISQLEETISISKQEIKSTIEIINHYNYKPWIAMCNKLMEENELNTNVENTENTELYNWLKESNLWIDRNITKDYELIRIEPSSNLSRNLIRFNNSSVILKVIQNNLINSYEKAWNEIRLLALRLKNNPFVIKYYGAFCDKDNIYIETENFSNMNLIQWLKGSQISGRQGRLLPSNQVISHILQVILEISQAVTILHASNVEHRDLKLENILINYDLSLKLINFEVAWDNNLKFLTDMDSSYNLSYYSPPEIRQGSSNNVFGSYDVYSLGILFFELLCTPEEWEQMEISIENNLELLQPKKCPSWLFSIIHLMINKYPEDRPTIHDVFASLRRGFLGEDRFILENKSEIEISQVLKSFQQYKGKLSERRNLTLQRNSITKDLLKYFHSLNKFQDFQNPLWIQFNNEKAIGIGLLYNSVHQLCCEIFSDKSTLGLKLDDQLQLYSFSNSTNVPKEQYIAFGRFLLFCLIQNIPLYLEFSPILYEVITNKIPTTYDSWMVFIRRMDKQFAKSIDIAHIRPDLVSASIGEFQKEAISIFESKYLQGLQYMNYIRDGFLEFLPQTLNDIIEKMNGKQICELLSGDSLHLNFQNVESFLSDSLSKPIWESSQQHKQTKYWFLNWLRGSNLSQLRKFLSFVTGIGSVPLHNSEAKYQIQIIPDSNQIFARTCFRQLQLYYRCKDSDQFYNLMTRVIEEQNDAFKD